MQCPTGRRNRRRNIVLFEADVYNGPRVILFSGAPGRVIQQFLQQEETK